MVVDGAQNVAAPRAVPNTPEARLRTHLLDRELSIGRSRSGADALAKTLEELPGGKGGAAPANYYVYIYIYIYIYRERERDTCICIYIYIYIVYIGAAARLLS